MPIDSPHPEHKAMHERWQRCRDAFDGEEAVKERTIDYLPAIGGDNSEIYFAYLNRANFFNAMSRTVTGLAGAILREEIRVKAPLRVQELLSTVGKRGEQLQGYALEILSEVLTTGRVALVADANPENALDVYLSSYRAEDIVNWDIEDIQGTENLVQIIFRERYYAEADDDPFEKEEKDQFRRYYLEAETGELVVEVWQPADKSDIWNIAETYRPRVLGGKPLMFIPVVILNSERVGVGVEKPPLMDLVNTNLSHYRNSADLEHGLHFAALPTPWVAGFDTDSYLVIGSNVAWVSPNENARAGYLEFSGHGLGAISAEMKAKEARMAVQGARLLEQTRVQSEAAEAVRLRQSGEKSVLSSIAQVSAQALSIAIYYMGLWLNQTEPRSDYQVTLNTDFDERMLDPNYILSLISALQGGYLSFDAFYAAMDAGDVYPSGWTKEKELGALGGVPQSPLSVSVPNE